MARFVVISGCSGAGKSTLIDALASRGYAVITEPGRRLVRQELASAGTVLPWVDETAFARRAIDIASADLDSASTFETWVFFDRGLVDAASALEILTGNPASMVPRIDAYHKTVFMAPPWPELFQTDGERRHSFEDAIEEYDRLGLTYPSLGYEVQTLPLARVNERADFVLGKLGIASS